ncbi:DUF6873 family GME fold protein [Metaclostridioides mangenotii]|uniref:DUF6873 family GME fold protein n=1 Tax=Metaclostridioides mangenotii TaxID=1540 RepID=UPI0004849997|nr:hypothetical protein [Clostridioides mangenotii]
MKFTKKPFVVEGDLALALVDKRLSKSMEEDLERSNIELIKTIECDGVYESINCHPDICICNLGNGDIVVEPSMYNRYKSLLKKYNFNAIKGQTELKSKYPHDIAYNVAIVGEYAIHNFKYTDKKILEFIDCKGLKKINVEQGYSKCSICVVDDRSVITSDKGIFNKLDETEIDCLLVESGHIELFDMNYGFIGGCTGLISNNKLAFFGDVRKHPNYNDIKLFLDGKDKEIFILGEERLLDLGSLVPLMIKQVAVN